MGLDTKEKGNFIKELEKKNEIPGAHSVNQQERESPMVFHCKKVSNKRQI